MKRLLVAGLAVVALQGAGAAQGLPLLKPGMWEVVVQSQKEPAPPPVKALQRVDKATSSLMLMSPFSGQEGCRAPKVKKTGAGYSVQTDCAVHDRKVRSQAQLQGDFSSRYTGSSETLGASNTAAQRFEGRWLGACKPGMQPGDLELPNRVTINLKANTVEKPKGSASAKHDHDHDHSAPGHKH